ncbi:MAG: dihydrolipoyllysine-residue succinyltransferase, partial [Planctomycetaceae bacterium]
ARRLVEAQQNAALLTTFNEVDMSAVKSLRVTYRDAFEKKYGIKLGFMSFFVRAVVAGLQQFPQLNAQISGKTVTYYNYCDIGIAIGGGKGLVVPVLRNAENMSFADIEQSIVEYANKAKKNQISLEELEGGTFTISNGGVFGSLLSTPIVNPPQSGVLGMHGIFDRPVAVDGKVEIRPMMYIALTYDHRIVDGREAVSFLRLVREMIEDPTRLVLEV